MRGRHPRARDLAPEVMATMTRDHADVLEAIAKTRLAQAERDHRDAIDQLEAARDIHYCVHKRTEVFDGIALRIEHRDISLANGNRDRYAEVYEAAGGRAEGWAGYFKSVRNANKSEVWLGLGWPDRESVELACKWWIVHGFNIQALERGPMKFLQYPHGPEDLKVQIRARTPKGNTDPWIWFEVPGKPGIWAGQSAKGSCPYKETLRNNTKAPMGPNDLICLDGEVTSRNNFDICKRCEHVLKCMTKGEPVENYTPRTTPVAQSFSEDLSL